MKIYTQLIDLSKTTPQNFYVPPHSKFKLGVKLVQSIDFSVKLDGVALASDGEVDGFKTFSLGSTNPGNTTYVVEAANGQKVNILQTTTNSTVFDVDSAIQEGNFVKSVNGNLPVNGNVDVTKLVFTTDEGVPADITGKAISNSLKSIEDQLSLKLEHADIVPIAPSTDATAEALAGARATAEFVNSSIATNTANFAGTYTSESSFPAVATNNDYLFLDTVDEAGNKIFKRYKYVAETSRWVYEYTLNNSSFTSAQWAAIQSGITAEIVNDTSNSLKNINASLANKLERADIIPIAPSTDAPAEALAGARATAEFVNSSFVKSVNGELPVNGNVDVTKLVFTTDEGFPADITGKSISNSLKSIEDQLPLKLERADIVPIAPATDAPQEALAGARATADFVDRSIVTNTANFAGTYTSESSFPDRATNNDYLFLDTVDEVGNKIFKRYKYTSDRWVYEYTLSNSSFTSAQWETIQSGITARDVADMAKKSELDAHTVVLSGEFEDGTTFNYTVYTK